MGTVYRKTVTRPLPKGAELFTRQGQQFARWKPAKGRTRTAKVTTGKDGSPRIVEESGTYIAKYRDGSGYVCEVSTGCRDEDAARSVLSKLERRAELVKSEVMSSAEASTADHQSILIVVHFSAYLNHVRAKGATALHVTDLERKAKRLFRECDITTLRQIRVETVEGWLSARQSEEMSARTRNAHLQAVRGFCKWCVQTKRLTMNPLTTIAKADEKSDRRRQRRAMTEGELVNLLEVARWRPLAEFGRESVPVDASKSPANGERRKRSNWTKAALTLDGLEAAVERARKHLAGNPEFVADLERLGRERALIYKTLVLTGLRKGELASLTVGQLELDGPMPFVVLNAADEKNRQGSTIPIRADLANDLKLWLSDTPHPPTLRLSDAKGAVDNKRPLFTVPAGLVRILDRDLLAAGIAKRDERGRTVDVHALRTSFGTLLSKGGVAPRTAQAALRHSKIDLTMNVYTDPKLLDVHGALESLPSLDVNCSPTERQAGRATGTDDRTASADPRSSVAPTVAPNLAHSRQKRSLPGLSSVDADESRRWRVIDENPMNQSKKALPTVFVSKAFEVEDSGIEPLTSCMPCKRSPS